MFRKAASVESFDRNVAEHHRVVVAGETEVSRLEVFAGMLLVRKVFIYFGQSSDQIEQIS